jgi:hypothetical protein
MSKCTPTDKHRYRCNRSKGSAECACVNRTSCVQAMIEPSQPMLTWRQWAFVGRRVAPICGWQCHVPPQAAQHGMYATLLAQPRSWVCFTRQTACTSPIPDAYRSIAGVSVLRWSFHNPVAVHRSLLAVILCHQLSRSRRLPAARVMSTFGGRIHGLIHPDPACGTVVTAPTPARGADRPDQGRIPMRNGGDGSRMRRRANRPEQGRTRVRDGSDGSRMRRRAYRPNCGRTPVRDSGDGSRSTVVPTVRSKAERHKIYIYKSTNTNIYLSLTYGYGVPSRMM